VSCRICCQWFVVRRPMTSVCKSTRPERGNQKQMEGGRHWDSSKIHCTMKQELTYRKQIARQLRTQFVEGISVTLKSMLRVTQGHWKRNHWTDHTRLTIRRVIGRWILSLPWNMGQRSLKVIKSGTIWKCGYVFPTFPTLTLTITLTLTYFT